jgi:hypothetical protein
MKSGIVQVLGAGMACLIASEGYWPAAHIVCMPPIMCLECHCVPPPCAHFPTPPFLGVNMKKPCHRYPFETKEKILQGGLSKSHPIGSPTPEALLLCQWEAPYFTLDWTPAPLRMRTGSGRVDPLRRFDKV